MHVDVLVYQHISNSGAGREKELLEAQGLKEYLAYISGKLDRNEWVEKEIEKAKQLRDLEPENEYYLLIQAHIYLYGEKKKKQDGFWRISITIDLQLERNRRSVLTTFS